jgi:PAS domain S-box-containing protein
MGLNSGIMLPLFIEGRVFGTISLQSKGIAAFGPREEAILERLSSQIAPAIHNSMLYEQVQKDEQKYQSLMNQSPDFLFVSRTDDLRFAEVNNRACEYYGYSREEFLSMSILDVEVDPPTQQEVRALYDQFPIGHVLEVYGTNKRKDGSTFPVHVRFSKLDETYAIANVRDITQQKMTEDEDRRQAEETSTARLNAAVSLAREEELVDSRRRVMTMSEGLRRDIAHQLHGTVQNKLIVLQQMMGQMAEESGVESKKNKFSKIDTIITDLIQNDVRGISQQLYPSMLRRGLVPAMISLIRRMEPALNVERQFAEDIRSRDAAERDFIPLASRLAAYRIAEDALTNVIKHSETNAATIALELQGGEQLRLTVRDEGVGFDSQSESASLGLAAMQDYAEVAGGKCEITSSPGRGTEVTALLPLRVES